MRFLFLFLCALRLAASGRGEEVSAHRLVVGGNESGVAAAVQAALAKAVWAALPALPDGAQANQ